jgi:hypothetical protein
VSALDVIQLIRLEQSMDLATRKLTMMDCLVGVCTIQVELEGHLAMARRALARDIKTTHRHRQVSTKSITHGGQP